MQLLSVQESNADKRSTRLRIFFRSTDANFIIMVNTRKMCVARSSIVKTFGSVDTRRTGVPLCIQRAMQCIKDQQNILARAA